MMQVKIVSHSLEETPEAKRMLPCREGAVLLNGNEIGQFTLTLNKREKYVLVDWFAIDGDRRNRGVGTRAYTILERRLAKLYPWATKVYLEPADWAAWRFWKRQGFRARHRPRHLPLSAHKPLRTVTEPTKKQLHKRLS